MHARAEVAFALLTPLQARVSAASRAKAGCEASGAAHSSTSARPADSALRDRMLEQSLGQGRGAGCAQRRLQPGLDLAGHGRLREDDQGGVCRAVHR